MPSLSLKSELSFRVKTVEMSPSPEEYLILFRVSIMHTSRYVKLISRRPDTLHLLRVLNEELFLFFNL